LNGGWKPGQGFHLQGKDKTRKMKKLRRTISKKKKKQTTSIKLVEDGLESDLGGENSHGTAKRGDGVGVRRRKKPERLTVKRAQKT